MTVSRRVLMYGIIAVQLAIMGAIVTTQELNIALDSGVGVDVELTGARVAKDPFRGAYVSGHSALDLDGRAAALPAVRLRPGEHVIVFFSVEDGRRPRITRVERRRRGDDPGFSAQAFGIPGRVRGADGERWHIRSSGGLVARVGQWNESVELDLPASIPVDESALHRLTGAGVVRASLHRGFLGHRYLANVRLVAQGWPLDASFAYDAARERLLVLAPRAGLHRVSSSSAETQTSDVTSDIFLFDGGGQQVGSTQVLGRLVAGAVDPADGSLLALVSDRRWGSDGRLARIGEDGRILERGPPIDLNRVVGFDPLAGGVWMLTPKPGPPHSIERQTVAGPRGPRLGPFASSPRTVLSMDGEAWVVETAGHRVTRLDATSGRTLQVYRDLNGPTGIAVDGASLFVIEAEHTQLSKLAADGRALWRVPRFQELAWVVADSGTGGAWVGAGRFEGQPRGVFRVGRDGDVTRLPVAMRAGPHIMNSTAVRLGTVALRDSRRGRLYFQEPQEIVVLGADGLLLNRVDSFRLATAQQIRR